MIAKQKNEITVLADVILPEIWAIAEEIGQNPELGSQEYRASALLTDYLARKGFLIQRPLAGLETAFLACYKGQREGPRIAFLAEYDALPDIGHGCGHHLIGAASVGAATVLSMQREVVGEIMVIGTPAEETSGAKVHLTEADCFDDLAAALMFHPGSGNVPQISSLALDAIEVAYHGKSAHMAVPDAGVNALDAVLDLFRRLAKEKKHLGWDERLDGIITEGGKSPNIVPEKTVARFYIRAKSRKRLAKLRGRFLEVAQKAAEATRTQMQWHYFEPSYDEIKASRSLATSFTQNLHFLKVEEVEPLQTIHGSVDMGNVSQVVPTLHAYLCLGQGLETPHTEEFAKVALSEAGKNTLELAVKALALTGWDVLTDPKLRKTVKEEFLKGDSFSANLYKKMIEYLYKRVYKY